MPELIERDALKNHLYRAQAEAFKHSEWYVAGAIQSFIELLDKQPTIEPEVRHGRWKGWTTSKFTGKYKDYDEPVFKDYVYYTCSECYRKSAIQELYCPQCGARMVGGADNG